MKVILALVVSKAYEAVARVAKPLQGLFKRNGRVYAEIVPDCSKASLQGIIRGRVDLESVIHSDGWRGYNGLVDLGYLDISGWNMATMSLPMGTPISMASRVSGLLPRQGWRHSEGCASIRFISHLKECEFRFNHRQEDIYKLVLKMLREQPLC